MTKLLSVPDTIFLFATGVSPRSTNTLTTNNKWHLHDIALARGHRAQAVALQAASEGGLALALARGDAGPPPEGGAARRPARVPRDGWVAVHDLACPHLRGRGRGRGWGVSPRPRLPHIPPTQGRPLVRGRGCLRASGRRMIVEVGARGASVVRRPTVSMDS